MWSRSCILLCIVSACRLRVHAGILHEKARSGDITFFDTEAFQEGKQAMADLNAREEVTDQTPLMAASLAGKHLVVDKLLRLGADHTITEKDGYSPPHGVAFQGRPEAARALIRHKVPMDVPHADGFTPLHRTIWGGKPNHLSTANILVKEGGANVNHRDAEGFTPAHRALDSRWVEMLNALLNLGADPNLQTRVLGDTLLHGAVKTQDVEIVKLVLRAGGDITIKNKKGQSSMELAAELPSAAIQALMAKASARRRSEIFGRGEADEKEAVKEDKEEL